MLNSKVFRLFWRDNLRSTRRRSASCPNLVNLSQESETQERNSQNNNAYISTSESESDDDASKKFVERLKVQQSIRRVHKKEKEKKENAEKKLISMDDYLGKLSELKTWLKEEQKKDVDTIKSPKLKAHFKTFVKLWNKRKLPFKYYKSCSVDLDNDDSLSPAYSQQPVNYQCSPFKESAKFSTSILHAPLNLPREENLNNVGSPFSTFGKCDLLPSPAVFAEQDTNATKCIKKRVDSTKERSPHKHNKYNNDQSSQSGSPPKFATISRAVPASSLFYKFTAQPWSSGENTKARPVLAPKCPGSQSHFSTSSFSSSPAVTRISSHIAAGGQTYKTDVHQTSSLSKSPGPSPVYSTTVDAVPYNTGSPNYAEIDESICNTPQKLPASGYCSISQLQRWKPLHANVNQSLNRRRSKSMEDIYSLPFKAANLAKVADFTDREYAESLESPPIPDRKYSPVALSSACPDQINKKTPVHKNFDYDRRFHTSPSKVTPSPVCSSPEGNRHKRQSDEGVESFLSTECSLKKAKATLSSNLDTRSDLSEISVLDTPESESTSVPVLSILTGSLNPTTRSKYKMDGSVNSSQTNMSFNSESSEPRLSMIKIQQLDESPKLPRRRQKRRSSSLSTTPGKGLTFGKASKMSAASPRRVSFAKNVKAAENRLTPGKYSPVAPICTRQTQDRRKFESFLSSHENLPKTKASSPDNSSSPKSSSPVKRSPQKYPDNNVTPISRVYHEKQDNVIKKDLFAARNDENLKVFSKLSTSTLTDVGKEETSPLSSTRQVGRRVLGAPRASPDKHTAESENTGDQNDYSKITTGSSTDTVNVGTSLTRQVGRRVLGAPRASPDKNTAASENTGDQNDYSKITTRSSTDTVNVGTPLLSSTRQVGRRVIGAPRVSPEKNIAHGLWAHSPKKVQNTAHFSPQKCSPVVPPVLSPQKHMDVSSSTPSSKKVLQSSVKSMKSSYQPAASQSSCSIVPRKNVECSSSSYSTNTTPQNLSSRKCTSSQEEQLRSPQKFLSQIKDGTSQLKYNSETKKSFDLPSLSASKKSINALVAKLTEKTSAICATELSESDDCLSSDEVFSVPTSHLYTPESLDIKLDSMNMSPGMFSQSRDELIKENEDFVITTLESSPGGKTEEAVDCIRNYSGASSVDILSSKGPDLALDHISKSAACKTVNPPFVSDTADRSLLQTVDAASNIPPAQELCALSDNEKIDSESNQTCHIPELNNRYGFRRENEAVVSQCFQLPVIYMTLDHKTTCHPQEYHGEAKEVLNLANDSGLSGLTFAGDVRKDYEKNDACVLLTAETEVSQANNKVIQVNHTGESSLNPASVHSIVDNTTILSPSTAKNEHQCDLKRLASIRASPKVVENDSWVTERRRSSRGKRQQSFRSAYNKHLLKTSSKECDAVEVDQISATESLNLTPDFLDSSTVAAETSEKIDNAQGTMPENATELVNKEMTSDKHGLYYNNKDLISVAIGNSSVSSPAKIKPPTLPKPGKDLLLARGHLSTANKGVRNMGKTAAKRRSSVMKSETISATPSRLEKSRIAHENGRTRLSTKLDKPSEKLSTGHSKISKRVSIGKNKVNTRRSNERDESNKQKSGEEESCVLVRDDGQGSFKHIQKVVSSEQGCSKSPTHSARKVSSNGATGRRRSKIRSIGEENKVPSFADKMKFFNQLRINDVKTQTNRAVTTRYSPQKQNQTAESSVGTPSKNSEHVSLYKTRGVFLAGQEKHSTEIM